MKTALLFLLAFVLNASADLIPTNRIYHWQPGVNVGIPGGIPTNRTMWTNLALCGLDTNGVADWTACIESNIINCAEGQYVQLPAGTLLVAGRIHLPFPNNKTLRGAGMGKTILKCTSADNTGVFYLGGGLFPRPASSLAITNGATKGSTNLMFSDTSTVVVGKFLRVDQPDIPNFVFATGNGGTGDSNSMSMMFMVLSKDAHNVQIFPDLPCDFTNSPMAAPYPTFLVSGDGFEDFTMDMTNSDMGSAFYWQTFYGCWLKNIEIVHAHHKQVWLVWGMNSEFTGCNFHDTAESGPNHEGLDFYQNVCWSFAYNNIHSHAGFPQIILGDFKGGSSGNVIAYNFVRDTDSGSSVAGAGISVNHGPHNMFNLFEGNVAQMFQSDGYYGSASDNTLFRNWFSGIYSGFDYPTAVQINRWSYRFNIYGNVLGSNSYSDTYSTETSSYPSTQHLIYRLGFPNMGNSGYDATTNPPTIGDDQSLDFNVKNSILQTNNFDYATGTIVNPSVSALPASLIYTTTPDWWPPGKRFPPIDTAASPMTVNLPAQDRFSALITSVRYLPWRR